MCKAVIGNKLLSFAKELKPMPIDTEIIDKLLKDYKSPEDVLGENGLLKEFTKAVLERAMAADPSLDPLSTTMGS